MAIELKDESREAEFLARLDGRRDFGAGGAVHASDISTYRKWVVTIYDVGDEELAAFADGQPDSAIFAFFPRLLLEYEGDQKGELKCVRVAFQLERGGLSNRLHLQGYVSLPRAWGPRAVLDLFAKPDGTKRRGWATQKTWGSDEWCFNYCTDETKRVPGTRCAVRGSFLGAAGPPKRLDAAIKDITEGLNPRSKMFADRNPAAVVLWNRGLDALSERRREPRPAIYRPYLVYICGDTGAGKSALARKLCKRWWLANEPGAWTPDEIDNVELLDSGFCNGYTGRSCVIFDDINKSNFIKHWTVCCKLFDIYPYYFNEKGVAGRRWDARCIMVTCKQLPSPAFRGSGYDDTRSELELLRRFTEVRYCRRGENMECLLPWVFDPLKLVGVEVYDLSIERHGFSGERRSTFGDVHPIDDDGADSGDE